VEALAGIVVASLRADAEVVFLDANVVATAFGGTWKTSGGRQAVQQDPHEDRPHVVGRKVVFTGVPLAQRTQTEAAVAIVEPLAQAVLRAFVVDGNEGLGSAGMCRRIARAIRPVGCFTTRDTRSRLTRRSSRFASIHGISVQQVVRVKRDQRRPAFVDLAHALL
jgi:hypothetical protein